MLAIVPALALAAATMRPQVPAPTPAPAVSASPNPAVDRLARDWFARLQHGNIDDAQLDASAQQPLDSDVVSMTQAQWSLLGTPLSFDEISQAAPSIATPEWVYTYRLAFPSDVVLDFFFGIDQQGKISGMRLAPEQ